MKTKGDHQDDGTNPPCKRARLETDCAMEFSKLQGLQKELSALDAECAKEQMKVQMAYTQKMKPLFEDRKKIIEKLPSFWGQVLMKCGELALMCPEDREILQHLEHLDLDDNLDEQGSYKLTLKFNEKAKAWFEPTTLVKEIKITEPADDKSYAQTEEVVQCTKIEWKPGKDPVAAVKGRNPDGKPEDADDLEFSIFSWFQESDDPMSAYFPSFGEVVRQDIFLNPLPWLVGGEGIDDSDEDDDEEGAGDEEDEAE